jgi:hypothetical protein
MLWPPFCVLPSCMLDFVLSINNQTATVCRTSVLHGGVRLVLFDCISLVTV